MTTTEQDALYNKIRGLLRKAEGTDNEHESEAFYNKAQELIMRYAIDEEKMWANDPEKKSKIETMDIIIMDRSVGSDEKRRILHACARANRCRMWYSPGYDRSTIAGYSSDLLFVEMLYSSVLTQMNFKLAIGQAMNVDVHHKTFKNSFLAGFAAQISERFAEIARKNRETIINENPGTELVLADRKAKVDAWVAENVRLGGAIRRDKKVDSRAYSTGRTAGSEVDITGGGKGLKSQKGIGK
jgi:hypothetical protein